MPLLAVLALSGFASSFSIRLIDPVVPAIARDLGVTIEAVALLVTAYAIPYAFGQPVLGTLGDALGKTRIIKACLLAQTLSLALGALSPDYTTLMVVRMVGGFMSGAIIPLTFAIIGDRFSMQERQLALSRILMAIMLGQVSGAAGSGFVAAALDWRAVMWLGAGLGGVALLVMLWSLPARQGVERRLPSFGELSATYARILRHPRALPCYLGVAIEGIAIFGIMPYIAAILEARGTGGIREAGVAVSGFALGGLCYTLTTWLLLRRLGTFNMMRAGGVLSAAGLILLGISHGWLGQLAGFLVIGFGFFMLHNGIQTQVTELVPEARGAAVALHAFSYFLGQAAGPVAYGIGLAKIGVTGSCAVGAVVMSGLGFWVASRMRRPLPEHRA
jgi:predicted MFS family arabinose efflux permease